MALMNELLEEAAAKAAQLSQDAGGTDDTIGRIAAAASELEKQLREQADRVHRRYQEVTDRLADVEAEVGEGRDQVSSALDGLGTRSAAARQNVIDLLTSVQAELAQLDEQRQRILERHGTLSEEAEDGLEDLARRFSESQSPIQEGGDEARAAADELRQRVGTANDALEGARDQALEAMNGAESAAWTQTAAVSEALDGFVGDAAQQLVDLGNKLVEEHNQTMEVLQQGIFEAATARVSSSMEPLRTAIEQLTELARSQKEPLGHGAEAVVEAIRAQVALAEALRPVLESAGALGN
jgi:chromosome segregation ATPase